MKIYVDLGSFQSGVVFYSYEDDVFVDVFQKVILDFFDNNGKVYSHFSIDKNKGDIVIERERFAYNYNLYNHIFNKRSNSEDFFILAGLYKCEDKKYVLQRYEARWGDEFDAKKVKFVDTEKVLKILKEYMEEYIPVSRKDYLHIKQRIKEIEQRLSRMRISY